MGDYLLSVLPAVERLPLRTVMAQDVAALEEVVEYT